MDPKQRLFNERYEPAPEGSDKLFETVYEPATESGQVTCLGLTFNSEDERRAYFLDKLRQGLEDLHAKLGGVLFTTAADAVAAMQAIEHWPMGDEERLWDLARRMEEAHRGQRDKDLLQLWKDESGFPHGEIEDILTLSDPPYYTACPNPFLKEFIEYYGKPYDPKRDTYHKEPFVTDVKYGKNDPVYQAHSYHTKVPYKAIQHYIEHFTSPGDMVGDFFCGTGMTALAALSLNRIPIVGDLSPYATFIARYYTKYVEGTQILNAWHRIFQKTQKELSWIYNYSLGNRRVEIQYVVWSDHYFCPNCTAELVFWDIAVDENENIIKDIKCPHCGVLLTKKDLIQVRTHTGEVKRSPVKIYETTSEGRNSRKPTKEDIRVIERCSLELSRYDFPTDLLMFKGERFGDMYVPKQHTGIKRVDQFYFPRSLLAASAFYRHIKAEDNFYVRQFLLWAFLSIQNYINKKQSYFGGGGGQPGTLTISDIVQEKNVLRVFERKVKKLIKLNDQFYDLVAKTEHKPLITTQSATMLANIPENSLDYIFTDPPFGRNLMYSELNFINESWLGVYTNNDAEAVINRSQRKDHRKYLYLMTAAFKEYYRILKPSRWITVEFHNSSSKIWNGIQEALGNAGFVVAQVAILDKSEKTFKQLESATGAVDKDLVISAYKPSQNLEEKFQLKAGTEESVWEFIRSHLRQLPVFISKDGEAEVIAERQNYYLFDRMVAFHVQRGITVPFSAAEFYAGLTQRFPERDGMYFLPDQVAEYDRKRMQVTKIEQLPLRIMDEASAIQWLRQELSQKPQTFQELYPKFTQESTGWLKHEQPLDLAELLKQNFLMYDGEGEVPSQIHSYLSSNYKELRNLAKDDPRLRAKAKDRWYVPDPNKAADLEKVRERALLREFERYKERPGKFKRNEKFRMEAIRAGFKKAWQERDYQTIINVAEKLPPDRLQEDPKLLMWYDQALTRLGR